MSCAWYFEKVMPPLSLPFPVFAAARQRLHTNPGTNETVERIDRLLEGVTALGMVAREPDDFGLGPILAVHSEGLINLLKTAYTRFGELKEGPRPAIPDTFAVRRFTGHVSPNIWAQLGHYCNDTLTPVMAHTWEAAYWSAQSGLAAAQAVEGGAPVAYGLCRPPGHHAARDRYGGYCYLNNAAIAAEWLSARGRRVAILDIDYHHGDGTQAIFYRRPDVFFCSLHADPQDEYPYYYGHAHERGEDEGSGTTLNLPLPLATSGEMYLAALDRGLASVIAFRPDLLIVSLGFDSLAGDPDGGFQLTPATFQAIGRRLAALGLPLVLIQEGGYLLPALSQALTAFIKGLVTH